MNRTYEPLLAHFDQKFGRFKNLIISKRDDAILMMFTSLSLSLKYGGCYGEVYVAFSGTTIKLYSRVYRSLEEFEKDIPLMIKRRNNGIRKLDNRRKVLEVDINDPNSIDMIDVMIEKKYKQWHTIHVAALNKWFNK